MKEETAKELIKRLRAKYKGDAEVLEILDRNERDIEYLLKKEQEPDYKGQTALQFAHMLEADLETWY